MYYREELLIAEANLKDLGMDEQAVKQALSCLYGVSDIDNDLNKARLEKQRQVLIDGYKQQLEELGYHAGKKSYLADAIIEKLNNLAVRIL